MYRTDTIKSDDITGALRKRHAKDIWFEEVRLSSGFQWDGRIDFLAISPSPSTGNKAIAYEVKVSKQDFRRDGHKKQRGARLFSDLFWYVAPKGVIPHEEIPDWAGLMEADWHATKGRKPFLRFTPVIPAPKRDKDQPSWGLVCSLVRNAKKHGGAL